MADAILSLNAGSSSLKFALFELETEAAPAAIARGQVEGIGEVPRFVARDAGGAIIAEHRWTAGRAMAHEAFLGVLLDWVDGRLGRDALIGVGHRVVHGGSTFSAPTVATAEVLARLDALSPLAPLHQPHNIAALRAAAAARPGVPQVACFDTAFHRTQPDVATRFALPREWEAEGVRRYGFHGLSYEYIALRLAEVDPATAAGRVLVAHLGNGASLCAMRGGVSIDTTMGFTAVDGLVMGTRCGAIDPGVLLYLMQSHGFDAAALENLIYRRSGLLGVSGLSSDMRTLLASENPRAKQAVELFVYRLAREAGALASSLEGLDGIVFTAGIGENSPEVRAAACERLAWLGVELDPAANAASAPVISAASGAVTVHVIPTDEERMIAIHTASVVRGAKMGNRVE